MEVLKYVLKVDEDSEDTEINYSDDMLKVNTICGWYTLDSEGKYCEDTKYIKYLHMPADKNVKFDLTKTHENDVHKPQEKMKESINELLMWISKHSIDDSSGKPKLPEVDFVSFRGLLIRIMWTPFEKSDSLMLCAIRLKGTIYLCQYATEENKQHMEKMNTDEMRLFSRYGYKFEQYMLSDKPGEMPDTDQPLSELEEMCCLFRSEIGKHKMLYGAEIDGLPNGEALSDLSSASLVELKTCKENPSEYSFTRFKLLKWWAQSSLAKVDSVVVGYRNDSGQVNKLEEIKVQDMPKRAKNRWDPKQCIVFINDFLNFVKHTMKDAPDDNPDAVYQFAWSPNNEENTFVGTRLPQNNKCNFIPKWYVDWLNSIPQQN